MTIAEKESAGLSKFAPAKEVLKLDEDGNIVDRYISLNKAAEAHGVSASAIGNAIHRHTPRKGFMFEYAVKKKKEIVMPKTVRYFDHIHHVPYGGVIA
jgi:pyruvoyl-dependent arginine decarboxylase (PvlArgDC)